LDLLISTVFVAVLKQYDRNVVKHKHFMTHFSLARHALLMGYLFACLALAACSTPPGIAQPTPNASVAAQATVAPNASTAPTNTPAPPTATPTAPPTATPAFARADELPPLTLDTIFDGRNLDQLQLDPQRIRTVVATGDIIPAGNADNTMRTLGNYVYPMEATKELLNNADLTVINLEAPIIEDCPPYYVEFVFCGRPPFMEALQVAGVDVATLENNHISNYGPEGVNETIRRLEDAQIAWADRSTAAITDIRGLRFGFLAFDAVTAPIDREQMKQQIAQLRPNVDVLLVAAHWGEEYVTLPEPAPSTLQDPLEIAHEMIDAGADMIIGNHPHWIQGVEVYKGKLITYAHGNFIFGQMWSYETRLGLIGRYTFYDDVLLDVEFTPTLIENAAQPVPLPAEEAQAVVRDMRDASARWARIVAGDEPRPYGQRAP
jgi:poly-gamma-glutamate synthesis protein (capsule biosynthesis protein)